MRTKFIIFVENMEIMNVLEKKEYIYSHLHQIDEKFINDLFQQMYSILEKNDPVVAYRAGRPITKGELYKELKESEAEIERGDCVTIEEFEKESEQWD